MNFIKVFLGLGSNIGDREAYFEASIQAIDRLIKTEITSISSIYETEPLGVEDQELFLNQVIEIETELEPFDLLKACQEIEKELQVGQYD